LKKNESPKQYEYGERGQAPTISNYYPWVCGDRQKYYLKEF